jgi:glutamate--cysteine ligase
MLPWAFEDGMGFERWTDYALDVPMYFVKRGHLYHDVSGQSFRDLMRGKIASLPGERATISDWANHLTTTFPEVRLKRYLEMRGADAGPSARLCALPALWTGLLYDQASLDAAWDLVKDWSAQERQTLRDDVPRLGFNAGIRGRRVRALAREVIALARAGLERRARLDRAGRDETHFLQPLAMLVEGGETPAEILLRKFHGEWNGSVEPVFDELVY